MPFSAGKYPAVFLDRDGTINRETEYLHRPEDFVFLDGVEEALKRLKAAGYLLIVVTNQSGVGRGFYTMAAVEQLHAHLQRELRKCGTAIDAFYCCPHHPAAKLPDFRKDCGCRKGRPGLLLQAAAEHDIDLPRSFMVGDKISDVEAGRAAGCQAILVETGYGQAESRNLRDPHVHVCRDLPAAATWILQQQHASMAGGTDVGKGWEK